MRTSRGANEILLLPRLRNALIAMKAKVMVCITWKRILLLLGRDGDHFLRYFSLRVIYDLRLTIRKICNLWNSKPDEETKFRTFISPSTITQKHKLWIVRYSTALCRNFHRVYLSNLDSGEFRGSLLTPLAEDYGNIILFASGIGVATHLGCIQQLLNARDQGPTTVFYCGFLIDRNSLPDKCLPHQNIVFAYKFEYKSNIIVCAYFLDSVSLL